MMQALILNSTLVVKPEIAKEVYNPAISKKTDEGKVQESNVVDLQKHKNFNRTLEAYSDCV
jgi:hypothetical protein